MTKGYLIYLPTFENSVRMANRALESAKQYGWNVELYEGVNGLEKSLDDYGIKIFQGNKKCKRLMVRPGTQGCFLSQYNLWKKCVELQEYINIFEHDVIFKKPMGSVTECDVYKFEGFKQAKTILPGNWFEGARAYRISPVGAKKILNWVHTNGAMPADWMLCDGIVRMVFDQESKVTYESDVMSFTKDLS